MERERSNELGRQQETAVSGLVDAKGDEAALAEAEQAFVRADPAGLPAPPVHPRLAGKPSAPHARVPEPDAIRPDSSPEWRELFKQVRRAVDRLRE